MFIPRTSEGTVRKLLEGYPVVAITGPRQSGKTTLVRSAFPGRPYVSLEDPDQRELATEDPRRFLAGFPAGGILDEAQRCPELFSYLQTLIDEDGRMGLFILTGSQQFGFRERVSQSLAGRAAYVPLLPLSTTELLTVHGADGFLEELLWTGLYPAIWDRNLDPLIWYSNYVQTYLERDVRFLINVRDLSTFQKFLRMCAARTAQLLNLSNLANDCGITHNTARAWLSVLEASYIVHTVRPHHESFRKRLTKAPKLYFIDTGLASWLLGIQDPRQLLTHPQRGPLFETWVVGELLKARFNRGLPSNLFFWRDRTGTEIDIIIDNGLELIPVEIKSGRTITSDYFRNLRRWASLAGDRAGRPHLVYAGEASQDRSSAQVLSWKAIGELMTLLNP